MGNLCNLWLAKIKKLFLRETSALFYCYSYGLFLKKIDNETFVPYILA